MKRNLRNWSILDAQGQPMKRGVVAAENPNGMQTYNAHPAVGLTTESLLSFYRQAETGNPIRQMDMFDDLNERDGEVRGMFNDRIEDVVGWEYEIIPPPARTDRASVLAAGELNDRLQSKIEFRQFLAHQLGAIGDGYASTNMIWDYDDGIVVPTHFYNVAPRRFGAPSQKEAHRIMLINGESAVFGLIPLEEGLWATTRYRYRNPYAAGLRRSTSWWSMFKLVGFKQFQVWVDMYGLPLAIGYYQLGASPESRQALDDAVRGIGTDGYALLSDETELTIKETSAGAGGATVHRQLIEICDAINTKLITGGSLNTGSGSAGQGSYNLGQVHKSRLDGMKRHDARLLEEMFARDIGRTFVAWNGFDKAAPPRLKIKIPWGDLARAQALEILGQAMPLSKAQVREEFNVRAPSSKDDELVFQVTAPPDPGKARQKDGG